MKTEQEFVNKEKPLARIYCYDDKDNLVVSLPEKNYPMYKTPEGDLLIQVLIGGVFRYFKTVYLNYAYEISRSVYQNDIKDSLYFREKQV